jgi:preprotein translocase subunit SecY
MQLALRAMWNIPDLRRKALISLAILILARLLTQLPVPGLALPLKSPVDELPRSWQLFRLFSAGSFPYASPTMLGLAPYILASLVVEVLSLCISPFRSQEQEAPPRHLGPLRMLLTLGIAYGQGYLLVRGIITRSPAFASFPRNVLDPGVQLLGFLSFLALGSLLLAAIAQLVKYYGLGNGPSVILLGGALADLPGLLFRPSLTSGAYHIPIYALESVGLIAFILIITILIGAVERRIQVQRTWCRRDRSMAPTWYLPIKVNLHGVLPIVYAQNSLLCLNMLKAQDRLFATPLLIGGVLACTFLLIPTYLKENNFTTMLQQTAYFIPGIRPGSQTRRFLKRITTRLALLDGIMLSVLAALPIGIQELMGVSIALSGSCLLVVVGVLMDTLRRVEDTLVVEQQRNAVIQILTHQNT